MPVKTLLFLAGFFVCSIGALFAPLLGILGYVGHYSIGPEQRWWSGPVRGWGIRFSFTLGAATGIGILLNHRRLRYGNVLLTREEKLLLAFLAIVWLSFFLGEPTSGYYERIDHPTIKLTKVVVFVLMLTHVVTTFKRLNALLWVIIVGALILGLQALGTPRSMFAGGRLTTIGGPDFREANTVASYLAAALPLIGAQFLRTGRIGKAICLASGAVAANTIILTRSRGAFVGLAVGMLAAVVLAPKRFRRRILIGVLVAGAAGWTLADREFIRRMSTIYQPKEKRDTSAQSRLEVWSTSLKILRDKPQGIGAGNFLQTIGRYVPEHKGRDAHSTYVRCYTELGIQGIALLAALIYFTMRQARRTVRETTKLKGAEHEAALYMGYGLSVALVTILACGLTLTLLYIEALWWFLALPICLRRALENAKAAAAEPASTTQTPRAAPVE